MTAPRTEHARDAMSALAASLLLICALVPASIGEAFAQGATPAAPVVAPSAEQAKLDILKGTWVRPDGGYLIVIRSVGPQGQLDAMYFNPNALPFAKAQASQGLTLRAHFELRAGGYDGSTYDLTYDPASDRLRGTYYQAVAKQKFDVTFTRK